MLQGIGPVLVEVHLQRGKTFHLVKVLRGGCIDKGINETVRDNIFAIDERLESFGGVSLALYYVRRPVDVIGDGYLDVEFL